MEFKRIGEKPTVKQVDEKYPTDLQMYLDPPTEQIDLEDFRNMAIERVKFLRVLESVTVKNSKDVPYQQQVIDEMNKQEAKMFLPIVKGYPDIECRRKDYISHYILRLCYCRSEEYRRWFLSRELEFFKLKFLNMNQKEDIILFMQKSQLNYAPISESEKQSMTSDLINSTTKNILFESSSFYKVPFTQVVDLVRSRRVFLKEGYAYVPNQDLVSILSSIFRSKLSHALSICSANLPSLEGDERIARVLKGLHTSYTGSDYAVRKDQSQVPYTAIDGLSKKSFPPCMRAKYETFKSTYHLRHEARLELGLFLKGIGVSLEDSIRFWREIFTKKDGIDSEKFQKQYLYNIRHSYGKEGKRANYTPHSCIKIIMKNVGSGENHGCPFKHLDAVHLRKMMTNNGLSVRDVGDVVELATANHFQLACTKYFEITHGVQNATGINHPNQYFEDSQTLLVGKSEKGGKKDSYYRKSNSQGDSLKSSNKIGNPTENADEWGNDSLNFDLTSVVDNAESQSVQPMIVE